MAENVSLSPEEKALLRSVIRKRQPSMLWIVASEAPFTPTQRDTIKAMLVDEMREEGGAASERSSMLKTVIEHISQL